MMNYTYNENMVMADVENKTYGELNGIIFAFSKNNKKLVSIVVYERMGNKVINLFIHETGYRFYTFNAESVLNIDTDDYIFVEGNHDFSPKMKSVFG